MVLAPKLFAVFLIIIVSQANYISCDDAEAPLDEISKKVVVDIAVAISSGIDNIGGNIIKATINAVEDVKNDLRLDSKLNKADKIIGEIKSRFEAMINEHNKNVQSLNDQIVVDTALVGGLENALIRELVGIITILTEQITKLVLAISDYEVDQVKLIAEELEHHLSGKDIAVKLHNNVNIEYEIVLKSIVGLNWELLQKYKVVRQELESLGVSSHTLEYSDEKIQAIVYTSIDVYVKVREQITKNVDVLEAALSHITGHF